MGLSAQSVNALIMRTAAGDVPPTVISIIGIWMPGTPAVIPVVVIERGKIDYNIRRTGTNPVDNVCFSYDNFRETNLSYQKP
jgi:hypothetical protein